MWTLGLDPALNGAAVLLSPKGIATVSWCWKTRVRQGQRVWEVAIVQPPHERTEFVSTLNQLALLIASGCNRVTGQALFCVACETPHIGASPQSGLHVAMTTGKLIGPLEGIAQVRMLSSNEWRKAVGINTRLKREALKEASLNRLCVLHPELADMLSRTGALLSVSEEQLDHLSDALGLACGATSTEQPERVCPKSSVYSKRGKSTRKTLPAVSCPLFEKPASSGS